MKQYDAKKLRESFMSYLADATDIEKVAMSGTDVIAAVLRVDMEARHILAFLPIDIAVFVDHSRFTDVRPDGNDQVRFRLAFESLDDVNIVKASGMLLFDKCLKPNGSNIPASFYYQKAGEFRELFNRIEAGEGEVNIYEKVLFFSTVLVMIHDAATCEINAAGMAMLVPAVFPEGAATPGSFLKQKYDDGPHAMNNAVRADFMYHLSVLIDTWGEDLKRACEAIAICYTTLGHRESAIENGTWKKEPLKA